MTIVVIRASIRISAVTSCIVCPVLHHVPGVVLHIRGCLAICFCMSDAESVGHLDPTILAIVAYTHCCPGHGVVTLMLSGDQSFCWLTEDNLAVVIFLSYPCCGHSSETSCWSTTHHSQGMQYCCGCSIHGQPHTKARV